jgi:hypothetical protein
MSSGMQEIGQMTSKELDDANLARMGKRPVLKVNDFWDALFLIRVNAKQRNFGLMSMLGFSCTILITWEGIVV